MPSSWVSLEGAEFLGSKGPPYLHPLAGHHRQLEGSPIFPDQALDKRRKPGLSPAESRRHLLTPAHQ